MEKRVGNCTIRVQKADITKLQVDAIVNAANNHLWMGGGVAGAIKRAGGKQIEDEAVSKGPIAVGEAVVTGAGLLPCKWVIHAAAMGQDLCTDAVKIEAATSSALQRAKELGAKSIAFPAIGTGVGGFPEKKAAEAMLQKVKEHIEEGTTLECVIFALFTPSCFEAFKEVLSTL